MSAFDVEVGFNALVEEVAVPVTVEAGVIAVVVVVPVFVVTPVEVEDPEEDELVLAVMLNWLD